MSQRLTKGHGNISNHPPLPPLPSREGKSKSPLAPGWRACLSGRQWLGRGGIFGAITFVELFFFIVLFVSPAFTLTMDEAVDYALKNNPELQALRLEESIAQGQREKAGLLFSSNPSIEGSISRKDRPDEEGGGTFTNYGVRLSQEFEVAGQRGLRINVADREMSRIGLEIKDRERILSSGVRDAFAKSLAARKRKELAREVVGLQEELVGYTKIKFQAGDVSALDVNLAEVELSKSKKELLSAERDSREALFALQGILGMKPDSAFRIEGDLPSEVPAVPGKEQLRSLMERRPDVKASSFEVEKTDFAVALIRREAFPNITLSGFYNRDDRSNEVGVELSIPLPFFDRKQAEKKESLARARQAGIRSEALRKTVEREFEQAYGDLLSAVEELDLFKREIMSKVSENLGLLNLAYKEGKIGYFEVRLAQKETVETQFAYLETQLKARLALNAIERTIGGTLK